MKWMKQFGIILLVSFVGEVLEKWIPLPMNPCMKRENF